MSTLYVWIALALTVGLGIWAWQRRSLARQSALRAPSLKHSRAGWQASKPPHADAQPRGATAEAIVAPLEPIPIELSKFVWRREAELTARQRDTLIASMAHIARPPGPLLQLLSPTFLSDTNTKALSDLVMSEPLMAAKLLGQVNSPLYGLRRPVTVIEQAVSLLGINTVHSICVQHLLTEAFVPSSKAQQRAIETLWRASAIASEIGTRLGKALNLPDQRSLPTRAMLSFIGPVAVASRLPAEALESWLHLRRLQRAEREQSLFGLNAGEIGGLLMAAWGLPQSMVDEVSGASRWLGMPVEANDPTNTPRWATAYLCTKLGERLATGELASLQDHDFLSDSGTESFFLRRYLRQPSLHLRSYLGHPAAQRLQTALQSPELLAAVQRMQTPSEV